MSVVEVRHLTKRFDGADVDAVDHLDLSTEEGEYLVLLGMTCIGTGAALAHPQLSGAVVALVPPDQAGMASAVTVVARQAGFRRSRQ